MLGRYDPYLVLASILVAIFASYTALDLAARVKASAPKEASWWLVCGAVIMGIGIWSMHFIGMLAFSLPIPLGYDLNITLLSLLIAIVVSGIALYLASRAEMTLRTTVAGGVTMGIGIASMHYVGMAAMLMQPSIQYVSWILALSVAIAIVVSMVALRLAFSHSRNGNAPRRLHKLASATVMGFAISGMHYTGMQAAQFMPGAICLAVNGLPNDWLAFAVVANALLLFTAALVFSQFDHYHKRKAVSMLDHTRRMHDLAMQDALTTLPNRRCLEEWLEERCRHTEKPLPFALVFIDLDGFKQINDVFGHEVGDALIKHAARRLSANIRREDRVARLGGDEFVVVAEDMDTSEQSLAITSHLLDALCAPYPINHRSLTITASMGVAFFPSDCNSAQALMQAADQAMYRVKREGRNGIRFYDPEYDPPVGLGEGEERLVEGLQVELATEWHMRPLISTQGKGLLGFEVEPCWRDHAGQRILPDELAPSTKPSEEVSMNAPERWVHNLPKALETLSEGRFLLLSCCAQSLPSQEVLQAVASTAQRMLEPIPILLTLPEPLLTAQGKDLTPWLRQLAELGLGYAISQVSHGGLPWREFVAYPPDALILAELTADPDVERFVGAMKGLANALGALLLVEARVAGSPNAASFIPGGVEGYLLRGQPRSGASTGRQSQTTRSH
jgi:diguanylate cyclase (GGDEF)-like protein